MDRLDVEIQKPLTGTNAIKVSEDELKTLAEKGWNRVNVANDQVYGNASSRPETKYTFSVPFLS